MLIIHVVKLSLILLFSSFDEDQHGQRVNIAIFNTETFLTNLLTETIFLNADRCMIIHFRAKHQQTVERFVLSFGYELVSHERRG